MENLNKAMLAAGTKGNLSLVEELVAKGADINYIDAYGNFLMFGAAWDENLPAMDLYYELGANLNYIGPNLLCNAAYNGKPGSVRWLLSKGADANFSFPDTDENALHYTISKSSEMKERELIVKMLIEAGTNVHQKTIPRQPSLCFMRDAWLKGETPLHRAAAFGSKEIIEMLLAAGADKSSKDANDDTPISWGSWYLRENEILQLLLYKGVAGIG